MTRRLIVEIVGDSSSLEKAFDRAGRSGETAGQKIGRAANRAGLALTAGLAVGAKIGFDELAQGQVVAAQTAAVLKSTGGIANVTAKQVDALAQSQSQLTGIDDELIQTGENLLLTFKNVRNEVGKGNAVFDRATKSALDLSKAGFGSVESASKMLGKALNDPVRGMTALSRAGVTFSASQKEAIKRLVESGDALGAQKLILKEVESQVGGSAKAWGETLPGQLSKARNAFEEMAAGITVILLPAMTAFAKVVSSASAFLTEHKTIAKILVGSLVALAGTLLVVGVATKLYVAGTKIAAVATKAWAGVQWLLNAALTANPIGLIVVGLVALGVALVVAWKKSETFRNIVFGAFEAIKDIAQAVADFFTGTLAPAFERAFGIASAAVSAAWNVIRPIFEGIRKVIQGLVDFVAGVFTGDWSRAWSGIKQVVSGAAQAVLAIITTMPRLLLTALIAVGKAIISGIKDGIDAAWPTISSWVVSLPGKLLALMANAGLWLLEKGKNLIGGLLGGILDKWVDVAKFYASLPGRIVGFLANAGSWLVEKGSAIVGGLLSGLVNKWGAVTGWIGSLPGKIAGYFGGAGSWLYNAGLSVLQGFWDGLQAKWDSVAGWVSGLKGKIVGLKGPPAEDLRLLYENGRLIMEGLQKGLENGWKPIEQTLPEFGRKIRDGFSNLGNLGVDASNAAVVLPPPDIAPTTDALVTVGESVDTATATVTVFRDEMHALPGIAAVAFQALTSAILKALTPLAKVLEEPRLAVQAVADALHAIGRAAYATRAALQDTVDDIVRLLGKIGGLQSLSAAHLQGRQHGGFVRKGSAYIVGEAGPELFIPQQSGTVLSSSQSMASGTAPAGGVVVNVYGDVTGTEIVEKVRRGFYDIARRNPGALPGIA